MRSRAVRVILTLLSVGALAAAGYLTWATDRRVMQAHAAAGSFESTREHALREVYELRAAQQAYVATGQSETFWFGKAATSVESLRTILTALASSSPAPDAHVAVQTAIEALQDFEQVDRRARSNVSAGQKLLASDAIFSDGLETTSRIASALHDAGAAVNTRIGQLAGDARRERMVASGAAALVLLMALLLLSGRPNDPQAVAAPASAPAVVGSPKDRLDLSLLDREEPRPAKLRVPPPAPPAPQIELLGLASVCTDLAKLADTSGLPKLLERAATSLDASGLVLWVADPDGNELVPIAAYGYPDKVLSRMGSLKADGENATSAAFRTGLVQTVKADAVSHGAIAAPLVTPGGCRGVVSAEVRHGGEKQPGRLAAASILAAQLATLVGPPAVRTQDRNTAAL